MDQRIGCSIISVQRIIYLMENKDALRGMLHPSELTVMKGDHIASVIAAKEAFFKALGKKIKDYHSIEVVRDARGDRISILDSGLAQEIRDCQLSISADGDFAMAVVLVTI